MSKIINFRLASAVRGLKKEVYFVFSPRIRRHVEK
jgi:hypothetical protein